MTVDADFILERKTRVNADMQSVWQFFSNPRNLAVITPSSMKFTVLTAELKDEIYSGMLIKYKVSPLWNIPLKWVTKITDVNKTSFFADEQESGPYAYWRHEHSFKEEGDKILMTDKVMYTLPLGFIGRMVNGLVVRNKLKYIFDYRTEIIMKIFPGSESI